MTSHLRLCLDVGITQTRVWLADDLRILAKASTMQGIRGGAEAAADSIDRTIRLCLRNAGFSEYPQIQYIAAAGMVTSELGPYHLPHLQGASGIARLAAHVEARRYSGCIDAPLFVVPGLRFGDSSNPNERDAMRGEETLFFGLLTRRLIDDGDALLNLGSHWKLILSNSTGEIEASYTGIGGELALAISRETILKSVLPETRPSHFEAKPFDHGRTHAAEFGIGRALFLLRLDTQSASISQEEAYWRMLGAILADAFPFVMSRIRRTRVKHVALAGYPALAEAWAYALNSYGVTSRLLTDSEVEESFCAGLAKILKNYTRSVGQETL